MKTHLLTDYQKVKALDLFSKHSSLFVQPEWFYNFENSIGGLGEPRWFIQQSDITEDIICLAALAHQSNKFGGKHLQSMSNYYSPYFNLIAGRETSTQQLISFFASFKTDLTAYDTINIVPCKPDTAESWCRALKKIGFHSHIYQHSINWYHPDIRGIDDYWKQRPSRLRHTLERKKEKMLKSGQYHSQIFSTGSRKELLKLLIDYHHCYRSSWKNVEPNPGFIDAIAELAWRQGKLRLGILYHLNKPVAGQIWFSEGDTASIFKLAHDGSYTKQSVGTVLTAELVDYVIGQDKISYLDFLTGDDEYKQDWMTHKRPLYGVHGSNMKRLWGLTSAIQDKFSQIRQQFKMPRLK